MYKLTPAAYIFTHQYLNTMQQGIQTAHCVAEFFTKSDQPNEHWLAEWAYQHKTLRILNAGSGQLFHDNYALFEDLVREYDIPSAHFIEPDVNDMMTAFGFIVSPELISRVVKEVEVLVNDYDQDETSHPMIGFLKAMPSAK